MITARSNSRNVIGSIVTISAQELVIQVGKLDREIGNHRLRKRLVSITLEQIRVDSRVTLGWELAD
jgi:hypothetical protein